MGLGLMLMVILGASSALVQATQMSSEDQHRWSAAELGSTMVEELAFSYTTGGTLEEGEHFRFYDREFRTTTEGSHFYRVRWSVNENRPIKGVSYIRVWVSWPQGNSEKVIGYETYR